MWEHLETPNSTRQTRTRVSFAVMLLLIMVNVAIIGSIKLWQKAQESDSAGLNAYLSALIGVGMTLINYVTKILLRPLTAKEHHPCNKLQTQKKQRRRSSCPSSASWPLPLCATPCSCHWSSSLFRSF